MLKVDRQRLRDDLAAVAGAAIESIDLTSTVKLAALRPLLADGLNRSLSRVLDELTASLSDDDLLAVLELVKWEAVGLTELGSAVERVTAQGLTDRHRRAIENVKAAIARA